MNKCGNERVEMNKSGKRTKRNVNEECKEDERDERKK